MNSPASRQRPPGDDRRRAATAPAPARTWRRLLVLAHLLTSVSWMTAATALAVLLALAATSPDPFEVRAAASMAEHLDMVLLAPMANASLFTGLVLALATPWGLVAHRWVLLKFLITVVQLHVGILALSRWLHDAASAGTSLTPTQGVVAVAMPIVVAVQAWLSLAKPGGRTRWAPTDEHGRPTRPATAPTWVFAVSVAAVVVDLILSQLVGFPFIFAEAVVLAVVILARRAGKIFDLVERRVWGRSTSSRSTAHPPLGELAPRIRPRRTP